MTDRHTVYGTGRTLDEAEQDARRQAATVREAEARDIPIYRPAPYLTQQPPAPTRVIPDDVLAELRWQVDTPAAAVTMRKHVLRALLDCYERHGMRVVGDVEHLAEDRR